MLLIESDKHKCSANSLSLYSVSKQYLLHLYRLHPKYVHAMNNLGNILKEQNELQEAEDVLSTAVLIQYVNNMSNVIQLAEICLKLVIISLSFIHYVLLTSWRPDFAAAWMNLGIVQNSLKKFEEAETSYWNAIKFRKKYPDCYYNLGRLVRVVILHCFF